MTENLAGRPGLTWLPLPDIAARLGVRDRDVRSWVRDGKLVSLRVVEGAGPQIPAEFLAEGEEGTEILPSLPGTLTLLGDCGLDATQMVDWLSTPEDELGRTPLEALHAGQTHAVRRVARTLLL